MADTIIEATVKLQLDPDTGEMVSKNELKKRMQKRAKKAAKETNRAAEAAAAPPLPSSSPPAVETDTNKKKPVAPTAPKIGNDASPLDPDAMFKHGFLKDVYHLRPTQQVLTRFPPEPNGYLHIGHAKAIAVNFGFARYYGGKTILRFDDTNPDKEKEEFFTAIKDTIQWLGFEPCAITYSSDNFQRLYDLAETMILQGDAYVCHCTPEEVNKQRGGKDGKDGPRYRCDHAQQEPKTNLQKFRDMKDGKYAPKTAFLRMKMDITNPNPQMWDLAAYRIPLENHPHYRTANQWNMYPTYDFTHGLCDSFEGITHSLCTTEFQLSRESYEWLNKKLGVYEPMQREYGRLNLTGTVMSKRKIEKLVNDKVVRDWNDPRLYTLVALRRRGIPPGAILAFINELGVTTARTVIQISRFEQSVRRYLESTVPRLMLVLDPIPVIIQDFDELLQGQHVDMPFSPKVPAMGSHKVTLSRCIFIDRADFREVDSPDYFRLAPGKTVGLYQVPLPIQATSFAKDEATGRVTEIRAVLDRETKKPKAFIHWVPEGGRQVEVRIHERLFRSDDPDAAEGGFMKDLADQSETVYPNALVEEPGFGEVQRRAPWPEAAGEKGSGPSQPRAPESVRFQGMRVAYFAMDSDSTEDRVVLNRIASLKEDVNKK